jgi:hypothetical protein
MFVLKNIKWKGKVQYRGNIHNEYQSIEQYTMNYHSLIRKNTNSNKVVWVSPTSQGHPKLQRVQSLSRCYSVPTVC